MFFLMQRDKGRKLDSYSFSLQSDRWFNMYEKEYPRYVLFEKIRLDEREKDT